jgi:ankyrin repeat protein
LGAFLSAEGIWRKWRIILRKRLSVDTGNTLLSVAAQNGNKSIIKALLRRGAGLNTQNHKGQTALHFCFTYGYTDLGNYLISKGADDTIENLACLTCYEGLGE